MINIKFVIENNKNAFESQFDKTAKIDDVNSVVSNKLSEDHFLIYYRQKRLGNNDKTIEDLGVKNNDIMNVVVAKKVNAPVKIKAPQLDDVIQKPMARIRTEDYMPDAQRVFDGVMGRYSNIELLAREYRVEPSVVSIILENLNYDFNATTEALSEISTTNSTSQQGNALSRLYELRNSSENTNLSVEEVIARAELDYDDGMIQSINEILAMGFDVVDCFIAFERTEHNPEQAVNMLLPP